eukprot:CAMPEP_0174964208 /NCGR_PEP_ID=MMETSP0004_2-20121128/5753_1 /TAXON_ID=420556 /ORGANISM="Ochromonas sp., Strain CCMP1393" /LENGTH=1471 /DNA_ID=CAMNT_0016212909 /DNA_START=2788 /DNA_END=7203 /DNA_ORIENTATION=+
MQSGVNNDKEVWSGILPKNETQAQAFVAEHPDFDGRGVIVGVLDTGVDPGAIGLEKTTDGKVKVIDIVDCTGSGDVIMSVPHSADENGIVTGASGRRIKVNPEWQNPSGKYRTGLKRLFELYPRGLKGRVTEKLKEKWDMEQKQAEHMLQIEIAATSTATTKEDLNTRLSLLRSMNEEMQAPDPLIDCIVFHDGGKWVACVAVATADTTVCSSGAKTNDANNEEQLYDVDMSSLTAMAEYSVAQEYRRLTDEDALNYGINIFDDGAILSIVVDSGAHGTHVAGIISAHHPDQPECNGVAPGAQIVSLKIGDTRLGSMETGVGFMRALIEAVKHKCNVLNMSFGEGCTVNNMGAFIKLAEEVVYTHNIVFVGSAGNNGPCISTVGAPCGTSSAILSIGAMVTESLMKPAYSMLDKVPPTNFTWSSVGPCTDGGAGVSILAPGCAITCVPNWTLNKKQLMNGTSMSAPNACGCIALLMSATKQSEDILLLLPPPPSSSSSSSVSSSGTGKLLSLPSSGVQGWNGGVLSSARYRLAVQNSAAPVDGVHPLGQHHGLIQVDRAWNHLCRHAADSSIDIPIHATVQGDARFKRGIYLRQPSEVRVVSTFKVEVLPQFHKDAIAEVKFHYEKRLSVKSTASWLKCPEMVNLLKAGKIILVTVDPTVLSEGLHVAYVRGYDESNLDKGAVFELPVTVIVPDTVNMTATTSSSSSSATCGQELALPVVTLMPCERFRKFLVPPDGCTSIEATVRDRRLKLPADASVATEGGADAATKLVAFHALQIFPQIPYRDNEKDTYLQLSPNSVHKISWPVVAGSTMEICLARYWSTLGSEGTVRLEVTLKFHGIVAVPSSISLVGGHRIGPLVKLSCPLATVDVSPSAQLKQLKRVVGPSSKGHVFPLGARDVLPDGTPLYQLLLEYTFDVNEALASSVNSLTPRWPLLNTVLYESPLHAQLFMLYDSQKNLLMCGDAWPSAYALSKANNKGKGAYTLRLQVRHEDSKLLESFATMSVVLDMALKSAVKCGVYRNQIDAITGTGGGSVTFSLFQDTTQHVVFAEPVADSLPKCVSTGDTLTGVVSMLKQGEGCNKGQFPLEYQVNVLPAPPASTAPPSAAVVLPQPPVEAQSEARTKDKDTGVKKAENVPPVEEKEAKEAKEEIEKKSPPPPPAAAPADALTESLAQAIRDAKLKVLDGLVGSKSTTAAAATGDSQQGVPSSAFDTHFAAMSAEYPTHLPIFMTQLQHRVAMAKLGLESYHQKSSSATSNASSTSNITAPAAEENAASSLLGLLDGVVDAANCITGSQIDLTKVAVQLGHLYDKDSPAAQKQRKDTEALRDSLAKAYAAKCEALMEKRQVLLLLQQDSKDATATATVTWTEFDQAYTELQKWENVATSNEHWRIFLYMKRYHNKLGSGLQRVNDVLKTTASATGKKAQGGGNGLNRALLLQEQASLLEELGWLHLLARAKSVAFLARANEYQPF